MKERKSNIYSVTVLRKAEDHVAFFPVLFHACRLRQRRTVPSYVRAVISLSAIEHIGKPSLII